MVGAWIALEDIAPGAGRFFIYPRSHLIDLALNRGSLSIASNHAGYKKMVLDVIREHGLECRAPALQKGDVKYETDFRSVYARVLDDWMGASSTGVLGGDFRAGAPPIV